ncbi:hypothetical protein QA601_12610 [Chitinispirillales bacterium ANBcel5]|uniref:hypothetical protein n=1 Tax=Cellulosispirillum alkaliphilum TaxID=3039283 RepID=UPI002A594D57|nr:hypothetical protein [Chitinispirillales bacterium ANBcel5]
MYSNAGAKMVKRLTIVLLLLHFNVFSGNEICELVFESCPENFHGDTIDVPASVVALSAGIQACDILQVEEGMIRDTTPPAIMFIIDHSGSMMYHYSQLPDYPMDPMGTRYTVTRDLIDTLHRTIPDAEVGIAIFGEHLFLDSDNHPHVQQMGTRSFPTASYMPLMRLDQTYGSDTTAMLGYEILMDLIEVEMKDTAHDGFSYQFADLIYQPEFDMPKSTNINSGFDAAKDAFRNTDIPTDNQFVIFLSDGEANRPRWGNEWEHVEGVDVPTTFTVFFTNDEQPPNSLIEMTENIRNSEYTANNFYSDIWAIQTEYNVLMDLLKDQVMRPFLSVESGFPYDFVYNDRPYVRRTDDGEFFWEERYPLHPQKTTLNLEISYEIENPETGEINDTTYISTIYLNRMEDIGMPDGFSITCWDRPQLSVRYEGSRINMVREYMDTLELFFDPGTEKHSQVQVQVKTIETESDLEVFDLVEQEDGTWLVRFRRLVSENPVVDDGVLQHKLSDSIIVEYRNPDIPLDTIRLALPFELSRIIEINRAVYYDNSADGFIDSIFISTSHSLTDEEADHFASQFILPAYRGFKVDSVSSVGGGVALHVREEGGTMPRTGITEADQVVVIGGWMPNGGLIESSVIKVEDMVAPVILSAQFISDGSITDTLIVTFSEQVQNISDNEPFLLSTSENQQYYLVLDSAATTDNIVFRFPVTNIRNVTFVNNNDSIWINFISDIRDEASNYQRNPLNRRVLLNVKIKPYNLVARVINNPYEPSRSQIPQFIRALDPTLSLYGQVVIIEPEETLRRNVTLKGKAFIYDVVKNPVLTDIELLADESQNRLYLVWDGRNSNGRKVGSGTYQAVFQINDNQGLNERKTVRIGVRQ